MKFVRAVERDHFDALERAGEILKALLSGVLLTTKAEDEVNTMMIGWGVIGVDWSLPVFTTFVREGRHTHTLLDASGEFTVNVPVGPYDPRVLAVAGRTSGRERDKIGELGLTLVEPLAIATPAIKEFPITLECRVIYRQDQVIDNLPEALALKNYPADVPSTNPGANRDFHTAYTAEIVAAYTIK